MKYLLTLASGVGTFWAASAVAHPGHTHTIQSGYHMVLNNLMIAGVISVVLLAARHLARRD